MPFAFLRGKLFVLFYEIVKGLKRLRTKNNISRLRRRSMKPTGNSLKIPLIIDIYISFLLAIFHVGVFFKSPLCLPSSFIIIVV